MEPPASAPGAPRIHCGVGLECDRADARPFTAALERAAAAGFRYVEPFLYTPVQLELNSHQRVHTSSPYHHLNPDDTDPTAVRAAMSRSGLRFSAADAHSSLLLPQIAVSQLTRAIDLAAAIECPIVMSDEGPVAREWMPLDRAFDVLCFTLEPVIAHAQDRGVRFALELHNALTAEPKYLARLLQRFGPAELGINFDTGNSFLAGNDPVALLRELVGRVIHVHLKDIPASQLPCAAKSPARASASPRVTAW
ncbi:MAG: sugar phosphate isomerase/epimerase [Verrucomicrobia bacterium]|nr:sugar phosphate isomerase/epimerase [Verrucomicrobiota bacterium]